jgi:hypothetical protein
MVSLRTSTGITLTLSFPLLMVGAILWNLRQGVLSLTIPRGRIVLERGSLMAAVVVTAIGFLLLEELLRGERGFVLGRIGAGMYFLGAAVILVAEASGLRGQGGYPLIVVYVVLAFLGEAVIGVALIDSSVTSTAIGWITLAWNAGWIIALPLMRPADLYFPFLHHMMPAVIGVALLMKR